MNPNEGPENGKGRIGWAHLLLFIPLFCVWVPFYNRIEPQILGFPFFYWFQLVWIFVSMAITGIVYYVSEQG
jgi:Protein of unknown function (DUF3311)